MTPAPLQSIASVSDPAIDATGHVVPFAVVQRNASFDFTKGVLVVLMVVYHAFNYFGHDKDFFRFLHFLPASFIFITGFLITHIYAARVRQGSGRVSLRLLVRGTKLFAIFVGLNIAAHALFTSNYNRRPFGLEHFFSQLNNVLVQGEMGVSVFEVLVPISYLLLVSSALLRFARNAPAILPIGAASALGATIVVGLHASLPINVDLLSAGLLGMLAGLLSIQRIDIAARRLAPLVALYIAYVVVVAFVYPTYLMNLFGVTLTLIVIYGFALRLCDWRRLASPVLLFGRYSLLSYIVQIAFLQVLYRILRAVSVAPTSVLMAFVLTLGITFLIAWVVDVSRRRWRAADRLYGFAFA